MHSCHSCVGCAVHRFKLQLSRSKRWSISSLSTGSSVMIGKPLFLSANHLDGTEPVSKSQLASIKKRLLTSLSITCVCPTRAAVCRGVALSLSSRFTGTFPSVNKTCVEDRNKWWHLKRARESTETNYLLSQQSGIPVITTLSLSLSAFIARLDQE